VQGNHPCPSMSAEDPRRSTSRWRASISCSGRWSANGDRHPVFDAADQHPISRAPWARARQHQPRPGGNRIGISTLISPAARQRGARQERKKLACGRADQAMSSRTTI
jgi:hypothetical protein